MGEDRLDRPFGPGGLSVSFFFPLGIGPEELKRTLSLLYCFSFVQYARQSIQSRLRLWAVFEEA